MGTSDLYKPQQTLSIQGSNLVSTVTVKVLPGENLVLVFNTSPSFPQTTIAYRVVKDSTQKLTTLRILNQFPWINETHTVQFVVYSDKATNTATNTQDADDAAD